jgi:hypothetical protein
MRGRLHLSRRGLIVLGAVLCFLAAAFAFEAKLAWFSPWGTPVAQISASKLQPADAPRLMAQALATPATTQHSLPEVPLLLAVALVLIPIACFYFSRSILAGAEVQAYSGFSTPLLRRPPPQS